MSDDSDLKTFELKINAAGSWANAGHFSADQLDVVKAHCIGLAQAAEGYLKFKLVDPAGSVVGHLFSSRECLPEWLEGLRHGQR